MKQAYLILNALILGAFLATQLLAWEARWSPLLGEPWFSLGPVAVYEPYRVVAWAWQFRLSPLRPFGHAAGAFLATSGLVCLPLLRRRRPRRAPQSRWARYSDLRQAGLFAKQGMVLGKAYGRTVRYDGEAHALVIAPSGSGKTVGIALPTALSCQDRSLFILDPKDEIHPMSAPWRSTFSRVIHLNPTSPTSDCYDPLKAIRIGHEAEIRDGLLLCSILTNPDGERITGEAGRHFTELSNVFLLGVIIHGLYTQQATTLAQVDDFFMQEASLEAVVKDMRSARHTRNGMHHAVRRGLAMFERLADRELSGLLTTVSRALQMTLDPLVARMTSRSDFTLRDLRERRHKPISLYFTVPYSDMERLRPLSRLIVRQVLDYCTQQLHGWRWRLLMLLDEVQALHYMPQIPAALTFVRGFGINLCMVTPSMNELDRIYGTPNGFLENAHVRVIFPPNDPKLADTFSQMTGTVEVPKRRISTGRGRTTSTSLETERLLSWTGVTFLPQTKSLLFVGNGHYPVLLSKKPFYRSWQLVKRARWGKKAA